MIQIQQNKSKMPKLSLPNSDLKIIIKRDGKSVPFDANKIKIAIGKAFAAVPNTFRSSKDDGTLKSIEQFFAKQVELGTQLTLERVLEEIKASEKPASVEHTQDLVEKNLMLLGYTDVAKAYILYRNDHAQRRKSKIVINPKIKELYDESLKYFDSIYEYIIFLRTYAKWLPDEGRRETWIETVDRTINFLKETTGGKITEDEYKTLRGMILRHEIMPSMRLLQTAGPACARENLCSFNCSYLGITKLKDFVDVFYLSMCGTGVGFSCEKQCIEQLPVIKTPQEYISEVTKIIKLSLDKNVNDSSSTLIIDYFGIDNIIDTHVVGDSKEGWCDALQLMLDTLYAGGDITRFDYSKIRSAGSRLVVMGGRSSGPAPLKEMLDYTREKILAKRGSKLSTLDVHDIICKIGKIVVMGSTRRTALISLSDLNDTDVRNCKKGQFWLTNGHRSMANNSAVYNTQPKDEELLAEWLSLIESRAGERGIFNRGGLATQMPERRVKFLGDRIKTMGTNPCLTADTIITTSEGKKMIKDLINKPFYAMFAGSKYRSEGFWSTGMQKVYKITLDNGKTIKATENHRFQHNYGDWVEVKDMVKGTRMNYIQDDLCYEYNFCRVLNNEYVGIEEVFDCTVEDVHCFVANGLLSHNCGEINLVGDGGLCNLSTIICRPHDDEKSLCNKIRYAAIIGSIQSCLTSFKYVSDSFRKNAEAERLLGVSITGQMDNYKVMSNPEILRRLRQVAIDTNIEYAKRLGINQSLAVTCCKPEGTTSEMCSSSSGVHCSIGKYYLRRVRVSSNDPLYRLLRDAGCKCEPEVGQTKENATTWVLTFPKKSKEGTVVEADVTALDMLKYALLVKKNYTEHNPSCTITVGDNEWIGVLNHIRENFKDIGGVSFLPKGDGHIYELAPFEVITKERYEEEIKRFNDLNIDLSKLVYYDNEEHVDNKRESGCAGGSCLLAL